MKAEQHPHQERRLSALREYAILDTPREPAFDEIAELVAQICEAPIAVVNLIDVDRQWFKAEVGLGVRSTPLDTSLCAHVILEKDFVEIPDTLLDSRMADNALCLGNPGLRFYAGATLRTEEGLPLGTLCVLDHAPRRLTALQRRCVEVLADQVMKQLELRLALRRQDLLRREIDHRVKNSLASVSALITMQSGRSDNAEVRAALDAVNLRLSAMVALHEELHQAGNDHGVDLKSLLDRSTGNLAALLPSNVTLDGDFEPSPIGAAEAQSIGVVINEFVSNAAKHGYPDGRAGTIRLTGRRTADGYRIVCADDGIGDTATLAVIRDRPGLGLRIIAASMASVQGIGHWATGDRGLMLTLDFPLQR